MYPLYKRLFRANGYFATSTDKFYLKATFPWLVFLLPSFSKCLPIVLLLEICPNSLYAYCKSKKPYSKETWLTLFALAFPNFSY